MLIVCGPTVGIGDVVVSHGGRDLDRTTRRQLIAKSGLDVPLLDVANGSGEVLPERRNHGNDLRLLQTSEVEIRKEHRIESRLSLDDSSLADPLGKPRVLAQQVVFNGALERFPEGDEDLLLRLAEEVLAKIQRLPASWRPARCGSATTLSAGSASTSRGTRPQAPAVLPARRGPALY